MKGEIALSPDLLADPALAVAERQLVMLGELAEIGMEVSRAFASSSIAASRAVEAIVSEDYFMPETGRARGCGAKDAADAFQKVSRSLRLTLMLEKTTAEAVRDMRVGIVPAQPDRTVAAASSNPRRIVMTDEPDTAAASARPGADGEGKSAREERLGGDREWAEVERPEVLPRGLYTAIVDSLAADVGVAIDWDADAVRAPNSEGVFAPPPRDPPVPADREPALAP